MPRLIVTRHASDGMERCRAFLFEKSSLSADRAARVIADKLRNLQNYPEIGRPSDDDADLRELVIPFGAAGYIALYRYDVSEATVYLLAFKHQREAGY